LILYSVISNNFAINDKKEENILLLIDQSVKHSVYKNRHFCYFFSSERCVFTVAQTLQIGVFDLLPFIGEHWYFYCDINGF